MAAGEVKFSIEEARRIRDELKRVSNELDEARRTSLRTIPEGPTCALLLDAVHVARDVGQQLPTDPASSNAGGFALASLARWASNIQAFMPRKGGVVDGGVWRRADGFGTGDESRMGGRRRTARALPDPDSRTTAMILDARNEARKWFEEMHAAGATLRTPDGKPWVEVLASAKPVPNYPKSLQTRSSCSAITKELYTFAYRGESTAVHSTAGLLGAHAAGQEPFPPHLILHNVLTTSFLVFAAAGNLLNDDRCGGMARRLDEARKANAASAGDSATPRCPI